MIYDVPEISQQYDIKVFAKTPTGEGIGKIGKHVIFVKNSKTKIGLTYKIKITKLFRTFAYAEINYNSKQYIGNSLLEL